MFHISCNRYATKRDAAGIRRGKTGVFPLILIALAMAAAAAGLPGCSKGYSRFMKLPADPSVDSELGWAAVISAYARAKDAPSQKARDVAVIRKGTVFKCLERKIDPDGQDTGGLWYRYVDGSVNAWINSADLSIFSSEEQARGSTGTLQ